MNVNFSAEDIWVDAEINNGEATTQIEKADLTIETSYGDGEVLITLTDPKDDGKSVSLHVAYTRVGALCDALLAVAKQAQCGGN